MAFIYIQAKCCKINTGTRVCGLLQWVCTAFQSANQSTQSVTRTTLGKHSVAVRMNFRSARPTLVFTRVDQHHSRASRGHKTVQRGWCWVHLKRKFIDFQHLKADLSKWVGGMKTTKGEQFPVTFGTHNSRFVPTKYYCFPMNLRPRKSSLRPRK